MTTHVSFYGRGASFPVAIGATGGVQESAGPRKVEESIRIVLGTQYGERVMRPTFGCNLKSLVFAPNNGATANLARHYVQAGLRQWEPRIELMEVTAEPKNREATLLIHIIYRLRSTQEVHSMVYPFYLEQP